MLPLLYFDVCMYKYHVSLLPYLTSYVAFCYLVTVSDLSFSDADYNCTIYLKVAMLLQWTCAVMDYVKFINWCCRMH